MVPLFISFGSLCRTSGIHQCSISLIAVWAHHWQRTREYIGASKIEARKESLLGYWSRNHLLIPLRRSLYQIVIRVRVQSRKEVRHLELPSHRWPPLLSLDCGLVLRAIYLLDLCDCVSYLKNHVHWIYKFPKKTIIKLCTLNIQNCIQFFKFYVLLSINNCLQFF